MFRKLLLVIVFLGNTLLFGQTGGIKGRVIDRDNGEELPFANLQLLQNGISVYKDVADVDGNFSISKIEPGIYDLRSASVGYETTVLGGVIICADKISQQIVRLNMGAIMMCSFVICEYVEPLIDGCYTMRCCFVSCNYNSIDGVFINDSIFSDSARIAGMPEQELLVQCKIYPNPFMELATLEIVSEHGISGGEVGLFDMSGKEVRRLAFSGSKVILERAGLAAGQYVYTVKLHNGLVFSGKFLVQ